MAEVLPFVDPKNERLLRQTLRLIKAFATIKDLHKRDLLIEFVEGMAQLDEADIASDPLTASDPDAEAEGGTLG